MFLLLLVVVALVALGPHGTSAFLVPAVRGRSFAPSSRDVGSVLATDSPIGSGKARHRHHDANLPSTLLFHSAAPQPLDHNIDTTVLLLEDILDSSTPSPMHVWAIQAIAEALSVVAKALQDDDDDDPYEVMSYIGSVTQRIVQKAKLQDPEESQVLGGRVVAILTRLGLLEDQLQKQAETLVRDYGYTHPQIVEYLGSPAADLMEEPGDSSKVIRRAESLLAWFLETIEGPGLRANNVVVPCMKVDFLDKDRYQALMTGRSEDYHAMKMEALQETLNDISKRDDPTAAEMEESTKRKSLHPMTIEILGEVLRVRAQNDTHTPIRFINDSIEGWEILAQATKLAERFVEPAVRQGRFDPDEASLIGGRVVAMVMRLEDLEWELVHRCQQESWIAEQNLWDAFGVLPDESCIRTLDERILMDVDFTIKRAERLLAIFLLNLEGPGVKAAGDRLLDGSVVDFLAENHYEILKPRTQQSYS